MKKIIQQSIPKKEFSEKARSILIKQIELNNLNNQTLSTLKSDSSPKEVFMGLEKIFRRVENKAEENDKKVGSEYE